MVVSSAGREVRFAKLSKKETILLLSAFDYKVDSGGFILTQSGAKIPSEEIPNKYLKIDDMAVVPGSLKIIDGTPTSISKFIRERRGSVNGC
jgi:hypothetical protein